MPDKRSREGNGLFFIVIVLSTSWLMTFFIKLFNLSSAPLTVVMIVPMVLALIFIAFSKKDRISDIGWRLPRAKYAGFAFFIPIFQIAAVCLAGYFFGLLKYNPGHLINNKPTQTVWLNLVLCVPALFMPFILLSLPAFIMGWINHIGEEFAWRGYLFKSLYRKHGVLLKAVLISGAVWWAWHLPMFFLSPVLTNLESWQLLLLAALSLPALLSTALIYSYLYIRSGSIWVPAVMHIVWNLYRAVLTGRLADGSPGLYTGNLWLINGEGIIGCCVQLLFGFVFLLIITGQRRGKKQNDSPECVAL
jgi:membrane protease YdiL (CAAX protease family)